MAHYDGQFQNDVASYIATIADLSEKLQKAKNSLATLKYDPPEPVELD